MTGRPVRRRVLRAVNEAGGWRVVLARIASGETVAQVARSFGVSRSFFSRVLHEDRERHALVAEARRRAEGDALLAEAVEMIGGVGRPDAAKMRSALGPVAEVLNRATLGVVDRLRSALGAEDVGGEAGLPLEGLAAPDFGRLHLEGLRAPLRGPARKSPARET